MDKKMDVDVFDGIIDDIKLEKKELEDTIDEDSEIKVKVKKKELYPNMTNAVNEELQDAKLKMDVEEWSEDDTDEENDLVDGELDCDGLKERSSEYQFGIIYNKNDEEDDSDIDVDSESSESSSGSLLNDGEDDRTALPSDWATNGTERDPFPFLALHGVKFTVKDKENPLEYFDKFFDENIFEFIVTETNRFANQFLYKYLEHLPKNSRVHKWFDTSVNEMKVFIGLLIIQGVDSKSHNSMYFSTRESIGSPYFRNVMSGRRFDLIQKFLHFVDNTAISDGSGRKLAKIKPFIDLILPKFRENYIPNKCISIDESLLGWKGRLSWIQNIPTKRKRFGIKFYELCEVETGYIWNFFVYTGRDTVYDGRYIGHKVSDKIVFTLIDSLLDKGYRLYVDNYFTSPELADSLVVKQTDCVGTLRLNLKEVPTKVQGTKLKKGETVEVFRRKSMILKWKNKKEVTVLSTIHDNSIVKVSSRKGKETNKPKVIADYNSKMGGIDLADNLLCHFTTARNRMKKFYKIIFRYFLDMSVLNAFITYKKVGGKLTKIDFIMKLSETIISKYATLLPVPSSCGGRAAKLTAKPSRLLGRHFPDYCPPTANREKPIRNCAECRKQNERKGSSYWCKDCNVALCVVPCFRDWHTKL